MPTAAGVSPGVSSTEVIISLSGFTLIYGMLAVVEVKLLLRTIRAGLPELSERDTDRHPDSGVEPDTDDDRELAFAY
jgi:cytochrome d ubiquinol oxidase subunit I